MIYAITVESSFGTFKALAQIELGESNFSGDQAFTGTITTDQWGTSQIANGQVQPGSGSLTGSVSFAGQDGDFKAKIEGTTISGEIDFGPFDALTATLTGIET